MSDDHLINDHIIDDSCNPPVRGFIHRPTTSNENGLVLTHGAGASCQSALLIAVAEAFTAAGLTVLRCDLPFRQARPYGPPRPGDAAVDRQGLKNAAEALRKEVSGRIFLGGHSYGGRQSTMLAADEPQLVNGLLLLSYPLHPPRKASQLRTRHLPRLQTPAMFVHGSRDPFGTIGEMESAVKLIPAKTLLFPVEGVGHDLGVKGKLPNSFPPNPFLLEMLSKFKEFYGGS